ncbi:MAG: ABC transporter ATP-binding protein [Clostridia bacterium]|nr:ABC transporter ATP-binding protein [Clostridia bacterium]
MEIIKTEHLYKSYTDQGEKNDVLKNINLSIEKGEFVAVMGPSGSGKTTLLFCMSGMDRADQGSILFENYNLSECSEDELAKLRSSKMGYIFQQPSLLKNLNILDNIILLSVRAKKKRKQDILDQAENLMRKTGILELKDRDITKVSGGQLQRAGICRALMNEPSILFCDEPTGALNSKASDEIIDLISEIHKEGTTILLVTHDRKVAARADRVLFMKDGEIHSEINLSAKISKERIQIVTEKMEELEI